MRTSITKRQAQALLWAQVLMLFVGTQMPGVWRVGLEASLHSPFGLSSWAHFVLFAGMALLVSWQPLCWPWQRVVLVALTLALLTEAMQFLAIDRHPRWIDVGIDMSGVATGLLLSFLLVKDEKPGMV
jgi:hypothetical protein